MRRRWDAGLGSAITRVEVHPKARVFRGCDPGELPHALRGLRPTFSGRTGKRMLFGFEGRAWLGVHLGMTGELHVVGAAWLPDRHDHLVLRQAERALVLRDPRMFGSVTLERGPEPPAWWRERPPEIVERGFTPARVTAFLARRKGAPIKAVLLMQEGFPGVGNWMADEVLWRAGIHPERRAGSLDEAECRALLKALKFVCRGALREIVRERDGSWGDPPRGWLFHQRWSPGGKCPRTGAALEYGVVGGRATCWSPPRQPRR